MKLSSRRATIASMFLLSVLVSMLVVEVFEPQPAVDLEIRSGVPAIAASSAPQPEAETKLISYPQFRSPKLSILSPRFQDEVFSRAPTEWRAAGAAVADVSARWQSDSRWTFFSLKNDRKRGKAAVLWNKHLYPGDVTVEYYFALKMEGERGQPFTYARDVNLTICSDGADLNKGYTFMFGGFNNEGSMILRNGIEVARVERKIPTDMNYFRHWFYVRVDKEGGKLTFKVDRFFFNELQKSEWVYEDSVPIKGDRIAIWTYDNAIMLSRVRITGQGREALEDPDWVPGPLKTPYDKN